MYEGPIPPEPHLRRISPKASRDLWEISEDIRNLQNMSGHIRDYQNLSENIKQISEYIKHISD